MLSNLQIQALDPLTVQLLDARKRQQSTRRPRPRPPIPALNAERLYTRQLTGLIRKLRTIAGKRLAAALRRVDTEDVMDASAADALKEELAAIKRDFGTAGSKQAINRMAGEFVEGVRGHNAEEQKRLFAATIGINPLAVDSQLKSQVEAATKTNVALIKTIGPRYFDDIEKRVLAGVQAGDLQKTIGKALQDATGVSERRARFWARDQSAKLNSSLNVARNEALGIKKYVWRTARDERVVGNPAGLYPDGSPGHMNHWAREGKIFSYNDPPEDGQVGSAYNCRCFPVPFLEDLEDLRPANPPPEPVGRSLELLKQSADRQRKRKIPQVKSFDPNRLLPTPGKKTTFATRPPDFSGAWPKDLDTAAQMAQWQWVHGNDRKSMVQFKQAVAQAFGRNEVVWNPRGHAVVNSQVAALRKVSRHMHRQTQKALAAKGVKKGETITLYRVIAGDTYIPGSVESWTTDPKKARKAARAMARRAGIPPDTMVIIKAEIPRERVLTFQGGPFWADGAFGDQGEWIIIGGAAP